MNFFEEAYTGTPPWDIGRPQPAIVELEKAGEIKGRVLDVGSGTGENALYLAEHGHPVLGIDLALNAARRAQAKARARRIVAHFLVWDATELDRLDDTCDTVIDSGLFHSLDDERREGYVRGLEKVLARGGTLFVLCFSEHEPGDWRPRRISREELNQVVRSWKFNYIRETLMESTFGGARAWLASLSPPTDEEIE